MTIDDLAHLTFVIQHNPNCPSPWLIRLPGKSLAIDLKPYGDQLGFVRHETGDKLFFGKTFVEAASAALTTSGTPLRHKADIPTSDDLPEGECDGG